jgi:hypothetical protein
MIYTEENKYTVDRWLNREASLSVTPLTNGGVKLERTATAVTSVPMISQSLEKFENLLGKTLTLTIKVNADNTVNGFWFGVWGGTQSRYATQAYGTSGYVKGVGVHKITFTLPASIDYARLNVVIRLNQASSQGENIIVDWAKLEVGSVSTAFSPRPYAEELALCQRYFVSIPSSAVAVVMGFTWGATTNQASVFVPLPTELRTSPTINIAPSYAYRDNASYTVSSLQVLAPNTAGLRLRVIASTAYTSAGQTIKMLINGTIDAEIY